MVSLLPNAGDWGIIGKGIVLSLLRAKRGIMGVSSGEERVVAETAGDTAGIILGENVTVELVGRSRAVRREASDVDSRRMRLGETFGLEDSWLLSKLPR